MKLVEGSVSKSPNCEAMLSHRGKMLGMKRQTLLLAMVLVSVAAAGQQEPLVSPQLDHMAGHWVLRGEISGKPTTHDVDGEWIIQHHYLRLHELSREKDAKGQAKYEAMIFVGMREDTKVYTCVWLDVYGGSSIESIGVAQPEENKLRFVFKNEKGEESFHNEFVYDPVSDAWEWHMDNISNGVAKPFGRVKLSRK